MSARSKFSNSVECGPFGKSAPKELAEEAAAFAVTERVEMPPVSADIRRGQRRPRFFNSIHEAMLRLGAALLREPLHGDVLPALAQVVDGGGRGQPVLLIGEPLGQVVRLLGSRESRLLRVAALDEPCEMNIQQGSRLVVLLNEASIGRLSVSFKLAHRVVTGGGRAAIVVARDETPVAEFNQAVIEALGKCEPSGVEHARSMVFDNDYFVCRRQRFETSLGEFRRAPTSSRLVRAGVDLAGLAGAQLRLRWPGFQISWKIEKRLQGVVFLVEERLGSRARHATD